MLVAKLPAFTANSRFIIPLRTFLETKVSEKKKLSEKIKEKENRLKKKQQELKNELEKEVSFCFVFIPNMTLTVLYIS